MCGEGWAAGEEYDNICAVLLMFFSFFIWWLLESSGIETFADLEGKSVVMGSVGGMSDIYGRLVYDVVGLMLLWMINVGFLDIVNFLCDGQVDAAFITVGLLHFVVAETESTNVINLIILLIDVSDAFIEVYFYFGKGIVLVGTYEAVEED